MRTAVVQVLQTCPRDLSDVVILLESSKPVSSLLYINALLYEMFCRRVRQNIEYGVPQESGRTIIMFAKWHYAALRTRAECNNNYCYVYLPFKIIYIKYTFMYDEI